MITKGEKTLLVKSRDRDLINELRRTFTSTEISVNSNNSQYADLIIIDKREEREIPVDTRWQCKIICIVPQISQKEIEELSSEGVDHILSLPEFKHWLFCLIKRYLGYTVISTREYKYKGITICKDRSAIIYNECKVLLTKQELDIFEEIIRKECPYCKMQNPSTKSVISRINRKTKNGVGIKLINNRYNQGYYIGT
mgnify:CR=1 FL=1